MINSKLPKGSVKEWIVKVKLDNSDFTLQAIGNVCGVSREYVRQVLNSADLDTAKKIKPIPLCVTCASEMSRQRAKIHTECFACIKASIRTTTTCPNCGTDQVILKSHIKRNKNTFCNNYCQFSYWGKQYGFQNKKLNSDTEPEWSEYKHNEVRSYRSSQSIFPSKA